MLETIKAIETAAELLFEQTQVDAAIDRIAKQINEQLAESNPLILCVLNGGIPVCGQLLTRLTMPLTLDSINASRYRNRTSGGEIHWLYTPKSDLRGRTVLIVDDILDEGLTLAAIIKYCREQQAEAIYSAVLVEKQLKQSKPVAADFVGLQTDDRYLFGYGLDYQGYLRNAPGIYACSET